MGKSPDIAERVCQYCGQKFKPTAYCQKYCGKQKVKGTCSWQVSQIKHNEFVKANPDKQKLYMERYNERLQKDPVRLAHKARKQRNNNLARRGLTIEQYDFVYASQNGVCAVCCLPHGRAAIGRSKLLAVDHDHETLLFRGLLCDDCNIGLGLFRDNPDFLIRAAAYLKRTPVLRVVCKRIGKE